MARKMKDSGIEWIGEIPEGWEVTKLKYLSTFPIEKNARTDSPYIGLENIESWTGKYVSSDSQYDKSQALAFFENNILFGKLRPYLAKVFCASNDGCCSSEFCILNFSSSVNIRYFWNLLISPTFIDHVTKSTYGTKMPRANTDFIKNICVPVPPRIEQDRIALYLDATSAKIDSLISETRSSIEEYKKLKQAVITQAVTKGVRGEREMKDSGVEWIGEIPVDWEISRIKYVSIFEPSCDFRKLTPETIITYSPMECIKNGTFERRTSLYGNLAHTLTPFQNGDIVMAKVTPCFENGNIAIMNELQSGYGLGSSELFVFRPQNINTRYLFYWLQNKLFVHQACATMTGTGGLKRISPSFVRNCNIHYPSTAEQAQIAAYLDTKCAEIDKLIAKKEQLVKELESYKKSLIYEVVTGKREV